MAIVNLTDGAATPLPAARLRVSLSCSSAAQLSLSNGTAPGATVAPVATISATSMIVDASDGLALVATPAVGVVFPEGATAELTLVGAGAGNVTVRRSSSIGGRRQAVLAEFVGGEIHVGGVPQAVGARVVKQPWHAAGRQAYFEAGRNGTGPGRPWAAVVDCSASMLAAGRQAQVRPLLEVVFGAAITHAQVAPVEVLAPSGAGYRNVAQLLDGPTVQWSDVLGAVPSPWPRLTPAIRQAAALAGTDGDVFVLCDGVPADAAELIEFGSRTPVARLRMLVLGRSPFEALAEDRPSAAWDDELAALRPLHEAGHVVVSLQRSQLDASAAGQLMQSLFPLDRP